MLIGKIGLVGLTVVSGGLVAWRGLQPPVDATDVPVGTIIAYAGTLPVPGDTYLVCDGSLASSSSFPELARVLRGAWGSSGSSGAFRLPDLRGQFLRGVTMGALTDPDVSSRIP